MTKTVEIKCDGGGNDIKHTKYMYQERLLLTAERMDPDPTAKGLYAQSRRVGIGGDKHFCGFDCLHKWSAEK